MHFYFFFLSFPVIKIATDNPMESIQQFNYTFGTVSIVTVKQPWVRDVDKQIQNNVPSNENKRIMSERFHKNLTPASQPKSSKYTFVLQLPNENKASNES